MSTRKTATYTAEFKAEAIKLVTEQKLSYSVAAKKLGIPEGTLATWVLKATQQKGETSKPGELSLSELRQENAE